MRKINAPVKKISVASALMASLVVGSANAAFDYTALTAAINDEVTAGLAFAAAALAIVMGAMVGLKLAKKFFSKAT